MRATVKIAPNINLEVEDKSDMETLHKAIVLGSPLKECNVCGNKEGMYYTSNKDTEGNIYINYKCPCGARSKLGQYKAGGFFWRDFEVWQPSS